MSNSGALIKYFISELDKATITFASFGTIELCSGAFPSKQQPEKSEISSCCYLLETVSLSNEFLWNEQEFESCQPYQEEKSKQGQRWSLLKVEIFLLSTVSQLRAFLQSSFCYKWVDYCWENNSQQKPSQETHLCNERGPCTRPFWKCLEFSADIFLPFANFIDKLQRSDQANRRSDQQLESVWQREQTIHAVQWVSEE